MEKINSCYTTTHNKSLQLTNNTPLRSVLWSTEFKRYTLKEINMSNQQTVLITGATSGIGFEFAKQFYAKGFNLILASRSNENLDKAKKLLRKSNNTIDCFQTDLSKTE